MHFWYDTIKVNIYDNIPTVDLENFKAGLVNYAVSPDGQAQLAELKEFYNKIPADYQWRPYSNDADSVDTRALKKKNADERAKDDPRKLIINLVDRKDSTQSPAGYVDDIFTIVFDVREALNAKTPQLDPNTGKLVYAPLPFEALLVHEIDHTLQHLREKFDKKPILTRACDEEKATAAERAYIEKLNRALEPGKQLTYRTHYAEPEFNFTNHLDQVGMATSRSYKILRQWFNVPNKFVSYFLSDTQENAENRVQTIAPAIALRSGCEGITEEELMRKTQALFREHGISIDGYDKQTIQGWINSGLAKKKLYPLSTSAAPGGKLER